MEKKVFLFLYTRFAGYFYTCVEQLVATESVKVIVIANPPANNAPFKFPKNPNIEIHSIEQFKQNDLLDFSIKQNPDLIYIAGWKNPTYRKIAKHFKKKNVSTVLGMDNQWKGTLKQKFFTLFAPFYLQTFFSNIWVPGIYQFEYARRLGFKKHQISTGLYTANVDRYHSIYKKRNEIVSSYPKVFLFIGNMWKDKGVNELIHGFLELKKEEPNDWKLTLIGGGPLVDSFKDKHEDIAVKGFIQPDELPENIINAGAFCLPSYHDAWGVVIHEAAAAGLPIICTDVCGAQPAFLINNYNGYSCEIKNKSSVKKAMKNIMRLSEDELKTMSKRSYERSFVHSPNQWVATIMNIHAS